jgi:hypothetical protein
MSFIEGFIDLIANGFHKNKMFESGYFQNFLDSEMTLNMIY